MKNRMFGAVILSAFALSCGPRQTRTVSSMSPSVPSLRSLAQRHGMRIGAAVGHRQLKSDPLYAETLSREFNMITPENVMKFGPLRPARKRFDFSHADALVDFAETHRMEVRGHTLVWHMQLSPWLTEGKWTRAELIEILREHIMTVVGRYRGRVTVWDVINEAVNDEGELRDTIWLRGIGPEYVDMVFRWAHEADPDALLFYNDHNAEGLGGKSDGIYAFAQGLLQHGVPIHGVGLQMHFVLGKSPSAEDVAANIKRLAELGLGVHVTEIDVRMEEPATEEKLAAQARVYRDMFEVCLAAENCDAFVLWGFTDRYSWIPHFFEGWGSGLIFDESYHPKPAYYALMDALGRE